MMGFLTMDADELEEGMYVHPPGWSTAPDRYDKITSLSRKADIGTGLAFTLEITTEYGGSWTVRSDDSIKTKTGM